jgi:hypothetical protein
MRRSTSNVGGAIWMSEEVLKVLQSIKDKELADLIRSYLVEPSYLKLLLIFQKLGITLGAEKVNAIIQLSTNYEERGLVFQQIGGIIIDGIMYVLQIVYNPNSNEVRIELIQQDGIVLQYYLLGDHNED